MKTQIIKNSLSIFLIVISLNVFAQGPKLSYYHKPSTELAWASCYIKAEKGLKQKIGFFPIINEKTNCPIGLENYSRDINIDKALVYLSVNSGETLENKQSIKDKIVMLCDYLYDGGDIKPVARMLEEKIEYAIENKAAGIIIISSKNKTPLYTVNLDKELPVIAITDKTAITIFESAGIDYKETIKNNKKTPILTHLPVRLSLKIDGKFRIIETEKFRYKYLQDSFTQAEMNQQVTINEQSVEYILKLFKELDFKWTKENIYYFGNYASKIFYTGYWGIGFSCDAGVYNVFFNKEASYKLSVHENTHSLLRKNSLTFSSFFDEGIARYAEAMAANKDLNNKKTIELIANKKLRPLEEMLDYNIGSDPQETEIGYPASGSLVEFLIEKYGKKIILRLDKNATSPITKTEIISLEDEWLGWLHKKKAPKGTF